MTISAPSAGHTVVFTGTAGHRIALQMSGVTIGTSGCCSTLVSIKKPNGDYLVKPFYVGRTGRFLDTKVLPSNGTYKIFVDPQGTASGNMTLTLYDVPADFTGSITPGGAAQTATTTVPGQNARVTFSAAAGQRVSLDLTGVTMGTSTCCGVKVAMIRPDGGYLHVPVMVGTSGGFMDIRTAPVAGTYTILVNPQGNATGDLTLTMYDVPAHIAGTITPGGAAETVTTTAPGQNASLTFTGAAGQRVALEMTAVSYSNSKVSLLKPDGTALIVPTTIGASGAFFDTRALPVAGTYKIVIDPQTNTTGSMTLQLHDVPADASGSIVAGGAPVTLSTTAAGQNAVLSFTGSTGQRVSLNLTGVSIGSSACCSAKVWVLKPDGTKLVVDTSFGTDGKFIDTRSLPANGTYKIVVNPQAANTGSFTATLYNVPADVSSTIVPGGADKTVTTGTPGQNVALTFSRTAGQGVSLKMFNVTMGSLGCCSTKVSIKKPDGTNLIAPTFVGTSGGFFDKKVAPATGVYKLVVDPQGDAVGDMTLTLYAVPADASASITPGGPDVTVSTTVPGQNAAVTFTGTASSSLTLSFSGVTMGARVSVRNPDGSTLLTPRSFSDGSSFVLDLPANGTYTIVLDPLGESTGDATLNLA